MHKQTFRIISYSNHDAATNMAIDEAILEAHSRDLCPPTLRLYGFLPSAVSIGANQKLSQQAIENISRQGFHIVRRPTGGRAVLHLNDLTYSFIGATTESPSGFLSTSITKAYKQISLGLQHAFESLGIKTEFGQLSQSYRQIADCFMSTCGADLHVSGKKLVGSAQLRRKHFVLQHGSILLKQEQRQMADLLGEHIIDNEKGINFERHANVFEITGRNISIIELERVMSTGFEKAFNANMQVQDLSEFELKHAQSLKSNYQFADTITV